MFGASAANVKVEPVAFRSRFGPSLGATVAAG